jgi:hypothetical protein
MTHNLPLNIVTVIHWLVSSGFILSRHLSRNCVSRTKRNENSGAVNKLVFGGQREWTA